MTRDRDFNYPVKTRKTNKRAGTRRLALSVFALSVISLSLPVALVPSLAIAQSTLWQTYYDGGVKALERSQLTKAQKQLRAALQEAERAVETNEDRARLKRTQRTYIDALTRGQKYKEAEAVFQKLVGADNSISVLDAGTAADLSNYAHNQESLGKFKESVSLYRRALKFFEDDADTKDGKDRTRAQDQIHLLINLSGVYLQLGDADKAEEQLRDSMDLAEKLKDDDSVATALEGFGRFYAHMGKFEEAESVLKKAVNLRSKSSPDRLDSTYLVLANAYRNHGDTDKAINSIKDAIKIIKARGDKKDPTVLAEASLELASAYEEKDWVKESTTLLERTLANLEITIGDESPLVAKVLRRLATNYVSMNAYGKAEPLLKRALALSEKVHGPNGTETAKDLQALGMFYVAQGKYDLAEPVYKRSLDMVRATYGEDHPNYAACLNNLAWLYANERKFEEARPLLEKGLKIRKDALGEDHPLVARNLSNLANIDVSENKLDDAKDNLSEAFKIQSEVLGGEHPDTLDTMNQLADLYAKLQNYDRAEALYRKLLATDEKLEGEDSAAVADDLDSLARVVAFNNRKQEADAMLRRADGIKSKLPGNVPNSGRHGIYLDARSAGKIAQEPLAPVTDKWALVVGISSFADSSINLQYAAKDAMDFRNYLVNEANFKADHVKLLLDQNATRDNIVGNLGKKWLGKAKKTDLVVIYVSTHGTSARKDLGDTNFIVAHETTLNNAVLTGIPMQWFTTGITEMLDAKRIVIVMDVCHGGAVTPAKIQIDRDILAEARSSDGPTSGKGLKRELFSKDRLEAVRGQVIIASSEADQTSFESIHYPNGVFTRKLIEGLRSNGKETTLEKAFSFMRGKVESEVLRDRQVLQTPVMVGGSAEDGQMVLSLEPKPGQEKAAQ